MRIAVIDNSAAVRDAAFKTAGENARFLKAVGEAIGVGGQVIGPQLVFVHVRPIIRPCVTLFSLFRLLFHEGQNRQRKRGRDKRIRPNHRPPVKGESSGCRVLRIARISRIARITRIARISGSLGSPDRSDLWVGHWDLLHSPWAHR